MQDYEPAQLALPCEYRLSSRDRAPDKLEPSWDHLLRRRLTPKLLQRQVAERIGVDVASYRTAKCTARSPGSSPCRRSSGSQGTAHCPLSDRWSERLVRCRTVLGLSRKKAARQIGVDQCPLARRERGEREPDGGFAALAERFLAEVEASWVPAAARKARPWWPVAPDRSPQTTSNRRLRPICSIAGGMGCCQPYRRVCSG